MAFGARLQALRRARGLTQEDLAAELNVSRQAVSKWESGRGYPEMEKILYICRRYGVSMDSLFDEEAPAGDPPAEEPAQPPAPQSLGRALGSFVENLSPANRWAGIGSLVGMTALLGLCARKAEVEQIGGVLQVEWRTQDDHVRMTGPSHIVYEGEYRDETD